MATCEPANEAVLSASPVYSARPTIRIDGEEDPLATDLVSSMEMVEKEGGMSALEMRFSNVYSSPEGEIAAAFDGEQSLRLGAELTVYAGETSAPVEIFRGLITAVESEYSTGEPPEIVVLAEDLCQLARMRRRTKLHEDVSISDLASALAEEVGLTPVVTGFTDPIGTRMQLNESDLAFVRRVVQAYDGDLQVVGDELHVSPRGDVARGDPVELALYSQLQRARVVVDLAHQTTAVTVAGWDPVAGTEVTATSTGAQLQPGEGRLGSDVLAETLGERSEHIGQSAVATADEAQALADASFDQRARRFVRVEGTSEGNPRIRVGSQVRLTNISHRFDNVYYVVEVCHRYDSKRGYVSEFVAEGAYLGENE